MSWNEIGIDPILPLWLILLLLFLGAAAVFFQHRFLQRRIGKSRARSLSLLRLGALFLLLSLLLNPSSVTTEERKISPSLAILVDTSVTMGLPGKGGKGSRLEEAKALLSGGKESLIQALARKYDIQLYALGDYLRRMEAGEIRSLKPSGERGDIAHALEKLAGKNTVALLFSDGNFQGEMKKAGEFPFLTVPVGEPGSFRDVGIKAVKAPALAFRGREVTIDVTLESYGYYRLTLPVYLRDGQKLLGVKSALILESPAEAVLFFSFTPEEAGFRSLSLSVPAQAGESTTLNNTVNLPLKVIRDKIRVLMISGSPSLNYRFMRAAFKNDPSIDLLSFVILRTPADILNVPLHEQSLIPFPVETLFSRELQNFDLLLFDNFPFHLYVPPAHMEKIRDFVRAGGGLAMIGGPHLTDQGRYVGTPMEEVLPVDLTDKDDYRRDAPTGVRLTRAGRTHPITRFPPVEGDTNALWREMPPLDGINRLKPKASAVVLLENQDGSSHPVLTVGSYGQGRVLILATDYSWKWYMGMAAKGKDTWVYFRFMEKMVRWLTKDPSLDPVQIVLPEGAGRVGRKSEIRVKVREGDFSPAPQRGIRMTVIGPEGVRVASELKPSGPSGEYLGSFVPGRGGVYKIKVDSPAGTSEEAVAIVEPLGYVSTVPDPDRLKRLSASTGGKTLSPGEGLLREIVDFVKEKETRSREEKRSPLWEKFSFLAVIIGLLSWEWYLRRRWGLA